MTFVLSLIETRLPLVAAQCTIRRMRQAPPSETALMEQHFAYWKHLNEEGVCLFGGPVLDPKGVYGIIVVRAATEDEANPFAAGDPSVKAGLIKTNVAEMKVAFVPVHHP
ncbi:MAG: YciI family protein [Terracidiphilus sp.]